MDAKALYRGEWKLTDRNKKNSEDISLATRSAQYKAYRRNKQYKAYRRNKQNEDLLIIKQEINQLAFPINVKT